MKDKKKQLEEELINSDGALAAGMVKLLHILGNKIAEKERYKEHSGVDAVRFYLMQVHHWTPAMVKSMSIEDLSFAIEDSEIHQEVRPGA